MKIELLKKKPGDFLVDFLDNYIVKGNYTHTTAVLRSLAPCFCDQCNGQFDLIMNALKLAFGGAEAQAIMTMDDLARARGADNQAP